MSHARAWFIAALVASVFASGQEVSFPTDTPIQAQLAPGSSPAK